MINSLDDDVLRNIFVVKSNSYSNSEFVIPESRILTLGIGKANLGIYSFSRFFVSCIRLLFLGKFSFCFIYGVSPLNHICSLFIRSNHLVLWSHDPLLHSRAKFSERLGLIGGKVLIFIRRRTATIFISSATLHKSVMESFGAVSVRIADFPYVEAIVNAKVDAKFKAETEASDSFKILFFGRVEYYKGVDILVSSLEKLSKELPIFELSVVGPGDDYFHNPGFSGYRRINSYISNESLKLEILSADLCVFPYRDATGTQAVQTALALGVPCLLSSIPLFREFCSNLADPCISIFDGEDALIEELTRKICGGTVSSHEKLRISSLAKNIYSTKNFGERVSSFLKGGGDD